MPEANGGQASQKPPFLKVRFALGSGEATLRLLWDDAPLTCAAVVGMLKDGQLRVKACHARHSGGEALFITPEIIRLGDENTTLKVARGDFLFGFEPKHICSHGDVDRSEVAWIYNDACQPRRWISVNGDPTNQSAPFKTVDVPLNLWAKVVEEDGFYAASSAFIQTGARDLIITNPSMLDIQHSPATPADTTFYASAFEQAKKSLGEGGVPIGACIVADGKVIGVGHNRRVQDGSSIHHGETNAIENTGRQPASVYKNATMYTTLSPCEMCAGTMLLYKIPRVVIGENKHFEASEELLRSRGVEVVVLDDAETKTMFKTWMDANPALWSEDIGEEAGEPAAKRCCK